MLMTLGLVGGCGPRTTRTTPPVVPCEGTQVVIVRNQTAEELEVIMWEGTSQTLLGMARLGRTEIMLPQSMPLNRISVRTQKGYRVPTNATIGSDPTRNVMLDTECRPAGREADRLAGR
jgi:hypothetical protein